jgi:signal transduction histidine kinase
VKDPIQLEDIIRQVHREGRFIRIQRLELLGSLTSGFAHDLNNFLSAIQNYLTGIRLSLEDKAAGDKAVSDKTILEDIDRIMTVSRRAASLVQSMVRFSRQSGAHTAAVNMAAIIEEVLSLLRGSLPGNIKIEYQITDFQCCVPGESTQLVQVFMNLCLNARDAMPDGGVLTITLARTHIQDGREYGFYRLEPGDFVCVEVCDTGSGIEEQYRENIFDPFFTTKENGNGVGLFIAREILRAHRGGIKLEYPSAAGTKFIVCLPVWEP